MTRAEVVNVKGPVGYDETAVLPAQPAIVDLHSRLVSAAELDRKMLNDNLLLHCRRIAANEAQFHGVTSKKQVPVRNQ